MFYRTFTLRPHQSTVKSLFLLHRKVNPELIVKSETLSFPHDVRLLCHFHLQFVPSISVPVRGHSPNHVYFIKSMFQPPLHPLVRPFFSRPTVSGLMVPHPENSLASTTCRLGVEGESFTDHVYWCPTTFRL